MKLNDLKNGEVAHSKVTDIYYRLIDGVLYKLPMYGGADTIWRKSEYSLDSNHFRLVSKNKLSKIKPYNNEIYKEPK